MKQTGIHNEFVSVVIVAYNESKYLRQAIACVLAQNHRNLELVIVDDGSTDDTGTMIRDFQDRRIKYICNHRNLGIAKSRNIGIANATGKYVFFTDADCMPIKNWIENGLECMAAHQTIAVEGATYYATAVAGASDKITQNPAGGSFFTCNMGYTRDILTKLNGFDERYKNYFEDTDLARRVLKDHSIPFSQDMIVIHQRKKKTTTQLFKESFSRYEGLLQNSKSQGKKFCVIAKQDFLLLLFPFLMTIYYRINSLDDLNILPVIYAAFLTARIRLWYLAWKEKVFYL